MQDEEIRNEVSRKRGVPESGACANRLLESVNHGLQVHFCWSFLLEYSVKLAGAYAVSRKRN